MKRFPLTKGACIWIVIAFVLILDMLAFRSFMQEHLKTLAMDVDNDNATTVMYLEKKDAWGARMQAFLACGILLIPVSAVFLLISIAVDLIRKPKKRKQSPETPSNITA